MVGIITSEPALLTVKVAWQSCLAINGGNVDEKYLTAVVASEALSADAEALSADAVAEAEDTEALVADARALALASPADTPAVIAYAVASVVSPLSPLGPMGPVIPVDPAGPVGPVCMVSSLICVWTFLVIPPK